MQGRQGQGNDPWNRSSSPQRQAQPPKSWRRRLLILAVVLLACALLAWGIGYALVNYFVGIGNSAGAANTATDFLSALLKSQNYNQAYHDLDAKITISLTEDEFTKMAQADDHCYGPVTDFNEQQGSATTSADNTQTYTYDMTRSKLAKTYPLTLTLQKTPDGDWDIISYGTDLGPKPPTCK